MAGSYDQQDRLHIPRREAYIDIFIEAGGLVWRQYIFLKIKPRFGRTYQKVSERHPE